MDLVKLVLSAIGALSLSLTVPTVIAASGFKRISEHQATGIGLSLGGFLERAYSPQFWALAVLFFALFVSTSRLANKFLRIIFFWLPAGIFATLRLMVAALLTSAFLASRGR